MEISVKNSTFDLPWNYQKLCEYQLSSLKKIENLHLNSEEFTLRKQFILENYTYPYECEKYL